MPNYLWPQLDQAKALAAESRSRHLRAAGNLAQGGWITALLQALGMSNDELARRLGVNQSSVVRMRQAEADGRVTIKTLQEVGEALGADFVYAFVPKKNFLSTCEARLEAMKQRQRWHKRLKPKHQRQRRPDLRKGMS